MKYNRHIVVQVNTDATHSVSNSTDCTGVNKCITQIDGARRIPSLATKWLYHATAAPAAERKCLQRERERERETDRQTEGT